MTPLGLGWPNVISVLRVFMVPILVALILAEDRTLSYLAAGLFVMGSLSDGLDGYLARRYDAKTRTGAWLDPLADKVFVASPVVVLTALDRFPLWAAIVIVAREVGIAVLRAFIGVRGGSMPASRVAKWKTTFQLLAITLYILPLGQGASGLKLGVLIVAVGLTVYTGLDYLARALGWIGRPAGLIRRRPEAP